MTDEALDRLGPVDYLVVEFPVGAQNFTGEAARELARLHESGTIRVMDLLILVKDADGSVEAHELSDLADDIGDLSAHRGPARRDAGRGGRPQPRGRDGAGQRGRRRDLREPLGRAVRLGRPPRRRAADRQRAHPGPGHHRRDRGGRGARSRRSLIMPLRPSRVGRVGVVGSPVAKAVVVGHAMGPGPAPVAKAAVVGRRGLAGALAGRQGRRRRRRRHPGPPPLLIPGRELRAPRHKAGPPSASRSGVLPCPGGSGAARRAVSRPEGRADLLEHRALGRAGRRRSSRRRPPATRPRTSCR